MPHEKTIHQVNIRFTESEWQRVRTVADGGDAVCLRLTPTDVVRGAALLGLTQFAAAVLPYLKPFPAHSAPAKTKKHKKNT